MPSFDASSLPFITDVRLSHPKIMRRSNSSPQLSTTSFINNQNNSPTATASSSSSAKKPSSSKLGNNSSRHFQAERRQFSALMRQIRRNNVDILDVTNPLDEKFFKLFQRIHKCWPREESPLAGLLSEEALEQKASSACCLLKALMMNLAKLSQADRRQVMSGNLFTAYGRRLNSIATARDTNALSLISDSWWTLLSDNSEQRIGEFLANKFRDTDNELVEWCFGECSVCFARCRFIRKPPCCKNAVCQICWQNYIRTTAKNSITLQVTGAYNLHCFSCSKLVPYNQALDCTERDDLELIRPKNAANSSVRCRICLEAVPPLILADDTELSQVNNPKKQTAILKKLQQVKGGHRHSCARCSHVFCRFCGNDDHPKLSCQQMVESDVAFQTWAKQTIPTRPQFSNGRRCPKCKIPVAHNGGCPHMTCPCGAEFCYYCGRRYRHGLRFLQGFHTTSKMLPFFSCPKLWKSRAQRCIVHSLVSLGLLGGVCPLIIGLAPLLLPIAVPIIAIGHCKK